MKIKALINCVGLGYDLKIGDIAELPTELARKLIDFSYAEEVKASLNVKTASTVKDVAK